MAMKMCYSALRWRTPDLEPTLAALKEAGWDGWEGRLPLDWLGSPSRLRRVCEDAGMPMTVYTSTGSPEIDDWEHVERNRRRMEFAAEVGVDCFMFMSGAKPEGRPVTDDDIRSAAEAAERWAEYAAQFDLEISYHIHTNTLVDNIEHWRLYMSCLDKAKLCIDVSHAELWGYDPAQSILDFQDQLNYMHLQDYGSCTCRDEGKYDPVWVDVGQAECLDFGGVMRTLDQIGYDRMVTACPGDAPPGGENSAEEAKRSRGMREYLKGLGY